MEIHYETFTILARVLGLTCIRSYRLYMRI